MIALAQPTFEIEFEAIGLQACWIAERFKRGHIDANEATKTLIESTQPRIETRCPQTKLEGGRR